LGALFSYTFFIFFYFFLVNRARGTREVIGPRNRSLGLHESKSAKKKDRMTMIE